MWIQQLVVMTRLLPLLALGQHFCLFCKADALRYLAMLASSLGKRVLFRGVAWDLEGHVQLLSWFALRIVPSEHHKRACAGLVCGDTCTPDRRMKATRLCWSHA